MTNTQFRRKAKSLKREVSKLIDDRIEKFIESGAVDFSKYENNYLLPKIFMSAMGEEIKFQFKPLAPEDIKERNNIENYL